MDRAENFDLETWKKILSFERLSAKETVLITATLTWAKSECNRRRIKSNMFNMRHVLDGAHNLIRFNEIQFDELSKFFKDNLDCGSFFTSSEISKMTRIKRIATRVLRYKPDYVLVPIPIAPCKKRLSYSKLRVKERIKFCFSKSIQLVGMRLRTISVTSRLLCCAQIRMGSSVLVHNYSYTPEDLDMLTVHFTAPFSCAANKEYTMEHFVIDPRQLSYSTKDMSVQVGKRTVVVGDIVLFFSTSEYNLIADFLITQ